MSRIENGNHHDDKPEESCNIKRVAELNDNLRKTFKGGRVVMTSGINRLGEGTVAQVLRAVREFDDFNPGDDPYGEHDFGSIVVDGAKCFWKIEYYDRNMEYHSPAKDNPEVTQRVLVIMLAGEY